MNRHWIFTISSVLMLFAWGHSVVKDFILELQVTADGTLLMSDIRVVSLEIDPLRHITPRSPIAQTERIQDAFNTSALFAYQTPATNNLSRTTTLAQWEELMRTLLPLSKENLDSCRDSKTGNETSSCLCDPFAAEAREGGKQLKVGSWTKHHHRMVNASRSVPVLDVAFLGDSIIERWNGTRYLGRRLFPENAKAFRRHFSKSNGSHYEGIALGSAGDIVQNLNWHVQNGLVTDALKAKVIWILIGTNNLAYNCSTANIMASSIMETAYQIRKRKPNVKIVIQGILPRGDTLGSMDLGETWKMIQDINRLLASIHDKFPGLYYTEISSEKLFRQREAGDSHAETKINSELLVDGTHPTTAGYELLGNHAESFLRKILSAE